MATEGWQWPELPQTLPTWPMANLLWPAAMVLKSALCLDSKAQGAAEAVSGKTIAATDPRSPKLDAEPTWHLPQAYHNPMPSRVGAIIKTSEGPRHLLVDELAKGLGAPKDWCKGQPAQQSLE